MAEPGKYVKAPTEGPEPGTYVKGSSGRVFEVPAGQVEDHKAYDFVSPEYAYQARAQELDKDWAEKKFGTLGSAAIGFGNEMALGLPSAANIYLAEARGDYKTADELRSLFGGLQQTSGYQLGGALGVLAPTLASAGEAGLVKGALGGGMGLLGEAGAVGERLALRVLPETPGLLGSAGRGALSLAARGATEGALLSMANTVNQSAIRNIPLTAESLASSGADGALFGGLAGGALGGVGAVIGSGAERIGAAVAGKGPGRADALVARRLGTSAEEFAEIEARPGGFGKWRETAGEELAKKKLDFASSTKRLSEAAQEISRDNALIRRNITEELDRNFASSVPKLERIMARADAEILAPIRGTMGAAEAEKFLQKTFSQTAEKAVTKEAWDYQQSFKPTHERVPYSQTPTGGLSWQNLKEIRDQLTKSNSPTAKSLMGILDSEMMSGMTMAEMRGGPALKGIGAQYAAATMGERVMQELQAITGRRVGTEVTSGLGANITPNDVAAFGRSAVLGGAIAGAGGVTAAAGALAAKGIGRILDRKLTPVLAEMAHKQAVAAKAGASVVNTQSRIRGSVKKFFSEPGKRLGRAASYGYAKSGTKEPKMTREAYQQTLDHVRTLVSDHHAAAVNEWAVREAGNLHPDFAAQLLGTYTRARNYLQMNMPPSVNTLNGSNLRKMPTPKGLNFGEYRFMRIQNVIRNPMSFLDKVENGDISSDEARAIKYVYPELHAQVTESVSQEIYEMKLKGDYLPMDKVASLGIALDYPVDSTLTSEYIGAVQTALNTPPAPPPPPLVSGQGLTPSDFMTPVQKMLNA